MRYGTQISIQAISRNVDTKVCLNIAEETQPRVQVGDTFEKDSLLAIKIFSEAWNSET